MCTRSPAGRRGWRGKQNVVPSWDGLRGPHPVCRVRAGSQHGPELGGLLRQMRTSRPCSHGVRSSERGPGTPETGPKSLSPGTAPLAGQRLGGCQAPGWTVCSGSGNSSQGVRVLPGKRPRRGPRGPMPTSCPAAFTVPSHWPGWLSLSPGATAP